MTAALIYKLLFFLFWPILLVLLFKYIKWGSRLEPVTTIYCVSLQSNNYAGCLYLLVYRHSSQI